MSTFRFSTIKPFLIGLGILSVGVIGLLVMVSLRPDPPREERLVLAPIVQTARALEASGALIVSGSGSVASVRQVALSAEVPGRVVWVSPDFVAGGSFAEGQPIARIDSTDYVNAVAMAKAEWTARRVDAMLAREESAVARQEWRRLQASDSNLTTPEGGDLGIMLFREPQVRMADAAVEAARARLDDARARLERTIIRAPFDGQILSKQAELGQIMAPGLLLATFQSTEAAEVAVPLRLEQADLLEDVYRLDEGRTLEAVIRSTPGSSWPGRIVRTEGALDPATRTLKVIARVEKPLEQVPPLFTGSFVTVDIEGRPLEDTVVIPRQALQEDGSVWVVDSSTLSIRPVEVLYEEEGRVYLTKGVSAGEQVVISALSVVTDGMSVRVSTN